MFGSRDDIFRVFLTIATLFLAVSLPVSAQQTDDIPRLRIISVEKAPSSQIIRDDPENYDSNGDLAAGLFIQTDIRNISFNAANGIVKKDSFQNEWRLLVQASERILTIYSADFVDPLEIILSEHGINLRPGDIWIIKITGDRAVDLLPVTFNISEADVRLSIDGQSTDPNSLLRLAPGTHKVLIQKDGFVSINRDITVSESSFRFDFTLQQLTQVPITIVSTPKQATIEINNSLVNGLTDWQGFRFPGEYSIRVSKSGYRTIQDRITVSDDPTRNTFVYNLESISGQLNLSISPGNARVTLNNEVQTGNSIPLSPGQYQLKVESPGYKPYTENFTLTENAILDKTVNLVQILGSLQFSIQPITAEVSLLNESGGVIYTWQGAKLLPLPIGTYQIRATASDFQTYTNRVTILENQNHVLNASMTPVSEIERQRKEQQRIDSLNAVRTAERLAAAQEREASKERTKAAFRHHKASGWSIFYNNFISDTDAFSNNVENNYGFGLGKFWYNKNLAFYMDATINEFQLVSAASNRFEIDESIYSLDLAASLVPTLVIGPFWVGAGVGFDYSQYFTIDEEYFYTVDPFYNFTFALKPKSWGVGFIVDMRQSIKTDISENYYPWNQLRISLMVEK